MRQHVVEGVHRRYPSLSGIDVEEAFQGLMERYFRDGTTATAYQGEAHALNAMRSAVARGACLIRMRDRQLRGWGDDRLRFRVGFASDMSEEEARSVSERVVAGAQSVVADRVKWLPQVMAMLKPDERDVVELMVFAGLEGAEAAQYLGLPGDRQHGNIVRCRKNRAVAKCRRILSSERFAHLIEHPAARGHEARLSRPFGGQSKAA